MEQLLTRCYTFFCFNKAIERLNLYMSRYPFFKQHDSSDCGTACLRIVSAFHNRNFSANFVRETTQIVKEGISLSELSEAAQTLGFETLPLKIDFARLQKGVPMPFVAFWQGNHYVVVYEIQEKFVWIADPASRLYKISIEKFLKSWRTDADASGNAVGYALILQVSPKFYALPATETQTRSPFKYLFDYLENYKGYFYQIGFGLLVITLINLILPLLVRSVFDNGINQRNYSLLGLLLVGQLILLIFSNALEFFRSVLFVEIAMRLNLTHTSDILKRILELPLSYFETKKEEDILQRLNDAQRLEQFFSAQSAQYIFAAYTLLVLNVLLFFFHPMLFVVSLLFIGVYAGYMYFFQREKQGLEAQRNFSVAENQAVLTDFVQGLRDIKIFGAEKRMILNWERIRSELYYKSTATSLREQWQRYGGKIINDVKNAVIIYISARLVVADVISVGTLMAIIFILGLMYAPIDNLSYLVSSYRATQRALVRLTDVHNTTHSFNTSIENKNLPVNETSIRVQDVAFKYPNTAHGLFNNLNLSIKIGETTAIVGAAGAGKTTFLKLLAGIYKPQEGAFFYGGTDVSTFASEEWFTQCCAIFNDSYIFNDTIAQNIALNDNAPNIARLKKVGAAVQLLDFIEKQALGFETRIGFNGIQLSEGQKQCLLIARALYAQSLILMFDNATNYLDGATERTIVQNLMRMETMPKTIIMATHSISVLKHVPHILVLKEGALVQQGNFETLMSEEGEFKRLFKV